MTLIRAFVVTFLLATLLPCTARAQESPGGSIQGTVTASQPDLLVDATVRAESDRVVVTTEPAADGSFVFTDLQPGRYRIDVLDLNNRSLATTTVTIGPGGITQTVNLAARIAGIGIGPAPDEPARLRAGALGVAPSLAFSSLGADTNVFNEPDDSKKRDTALTIIPQAILTLDSQRLRGGALARGSYVYFDKFSDERSFSGLVDGRLELLLGRVTPWVAGGIDGGRRRVNHEIDLRAQQLTSTVRLGVDVQAASRTVVSADVGRIEMGFDPLEVFRSVNLQELLNHQADSVAVEVRQGLNGNITALARGGGRRYRFRFAPRRDAEATTWEGGVAINLTDVVAVRAHVGYIDLTGLGNDIATYRGGIASVQSSFELPRRTRLVIEGARDVVYSYEPLFPYFISTSGTVAIDHSILTALSVRGRITGEQMAHRVAANITTGGYTEGYAFLGAGVGYSVLHDIQVGFDFGREERGSPFPARAYSGYRFGASVTLGSGRMVGGPIRQ